ncbi:MAG: multiple sugar transport system permease protein, partial [Candidatus Atribacteria bacterium]|nr:multiple sugar transport system permease protein [Candidatus Atribacteria bacterium]
MSKLFLLPAILVPILVGVIPFFLGVGLSFTDWSMVTPDVSFVGLENYFFI